MTKIGVDVEIVWYREEATIDELFRLLEGLVIVIGAVTVCQLESEYPMGIARIIGKGPQWVGIGTELHKLYVVQLKERYGVEAEIKPIGADN